MLLVFVDIVEITINTGMYGHGHFLPMRTLVEERGFFSVGHEASFNQNRGNIRGF